MRAIPTLLVTFALPLCAATSLAQNIDFLRDAPIAHMTKEDIALMERNYLQALDSLPDGHTNTWTNPKTGASGTATPTRTTKQDGATCRMLEITNQAGGRSGRSEWTFCETKGGWRTSGR